jgi:SAM-dependent methyltransferase
MSVADDRPGDRTYMEYVGSPALYDFMGAMQFRLLCALGLRAHHRLLDFGCGSLRAGRLFIAYLNEERYYGVEPNKWLVDEAIEHQVGRDTVDAKRPRFDFSAEPRAGVFGIQFDFIVAQSIFSHAGADLIRRALASFRESLKADGMVAATFCEGARDFTGAGWIYPEFVEYRPRTVASFARSAGLFVTRIPWYHPGQAWYLFATDGKRLPGRCAKRFLTGAVLDSESSSSWKPSGRAVVALRRYARLVLPTPVKNCLKRLTGRARVPNQGRES